MKTKSLIDCTENRVYLLKLNETVMKQKQPKFDAIFELNTKELQVNSFELTDNKLDDSMFKQALQALVERKVRKRSRKIKNPSTFSRFFKMERLSMPDWMERT